MHVRTAEPFCACQNSSVSIARVCAFSLLAGLVVQNALCLLMQGDNSRSTVLDSLPRSALVQAPPSHWLQP